MPTTRDFQGFTIAVCGCPRCGGWEVAVRTDRGGWRCLGCLTIHDDDVKLVDFPECFVPASLDGGFTSARSLN